jgi:hypothetical protein
MPAPGKILLRILFAFLIASSIFLFLPKTAFAQVVINEFVPNATPEWVEFYNAGSPVDLANCYFDDDNVLIVNGAVQKGAPDPGSDPIQLSGILSPGNTCFLELASYLNNGTDTPSLFLNDGSLIDSYQYTSTEPDKSFTRVPDGGSWQASQTPSKSPNKCSDLVPSPAPTSLPTLVSTSTPTPTPTSVSGSYPSGIYISEFMANPEIGDDEWVEINNTNSEQIVLTDWYIDDKEDGGESPKKFSATISANGYYIINISSGTLNNDGDDVRLLNPDGEEVDIKSYSETTKRKSWSKDSDGNWCQLDPTKGESNFSCPSSGSSPTSTPTPTGTPTPKLTPTSTPIPSEEPSPTPTETGEVLGATEAGEQSETSNSDEDQKEKPGSSLTDFLPKILIISGSLLIVGAFYPFWWPKLADFLKKFSKRKEIKNTV